MTARAKDHDEIVRVMQLYVDGFNDNDVGKLKRLFTTTPGSFTSMLMAD
jgi:hypothetical protein